LQLLLLLLPQGLAEKSEVLWKTTARGHVASFQTGNPNTLADLGSGRLSGGPWDTGHSHHCAPQLTHTRKLASIDDAQKKQNALFESGVYVSR